MRANGDTCVRVLCCLVELGCGEVESTKDLSGHVVVTIIGTRVLLSSVTYHSCVSVTTLR